MKNIQISILCIMMITTTISCLENSDDQTIKQQAIDDFVFKIFTEKKSFSKFEDKFIITSKPLVYFENFDNSDNQPIEQAVNIDSDDQKNDRRFITRTEVENFIAILLILYIIASIKHDFFPNEEQQKLRVLNKENTGVTGMSRSLECASINQITNYFRKTR